MVAAAYNRDGEPSSPYQPPLVTQLSQLVHLPNASLPTVPIGTPLGIAPPVAAPINASVGPAVTAVANEVRGPAATAITNQVRALLPKAKQ